jgi:serine/threonine protein kinase
VFLCSNQDNEAKTFFLSVQKRPQLISLHPGISHVYGLYQDESDIFLLQAYSKLSLLSLSRFHAQTNFFNPTLGRSSGRGARDLRLRFIIFQLLQVTSFLHAEGLCLESTGLGNIMIDEDMWLTIPFGTSTRFLQAATETTKKVISNSSDHSVLLQTQEFIERPIGYREPLISQWISGKLSNFEYLMQINAAAGRKLVDPLYHPILPWVTDFSSDFFASRSESGIRQLSLSSKKSRPSSELRRDLTKTKFRLSKGDNQLELTYRHSEPPHHVPESLSELTYYIYMARRTPMHVSYHVLVTLQLIKFLIYSMTVDTLSSRTRCICARTLSCFYESYL